jgi:hypothetical protein
MIKGWSRPIRIEISAIISGVALGPSRILAGSPGTRWIIKNIRVIATPMIRIPRKIRFIK